MILYFKKNPPILVFLYFFNIFPFKKLNKITDTTDQNNIMQSIKKCNSTPNSFISVSKIALPWNIGESFHSVTIPELQYCPKDNSINTNGIPVINNIKMKGIKNAPEKYEKKV